MRRKAVSPRELARLGWRRTDGTRGKLSAVYEHVDGWRLAHCGHPTANHPYLLTDPAGRVVLTGAAGPKRDPNFGRAWDTVALAVEYVASLPGARQPAAACGVCGGDPGEGSTLCAPCRAVGDSKGSAAAPVSKGGRPTLGGSRMVSRCVQASPETWAAIEAFASARGISIAAACREAFAEWVERASNETPPG